jgi:hypothetical protein
MDTRLSPQHMVDLIRAKAALGCDIGEDPVDQQQDVRVVGRVDLLATDTSGGDESGPPQLTQLLTDSRDSATDPFGQPPNVVISMGQRNIRCSRVGVDSKSQTPAAMSTCTGLSLDPRIGVVGRVCRG